MTNRLPGYLHPYNETTLLVVLGTVFFVWSTLQYIGIYDYKHFKALTVKKVFYHLALLEFIQHDLHLLSFHLTSMK